MTDSYQLLPGAFSATAGNTTAWGRLNLFADADTMGLEHMTLGRVLITAGQANPLHTHPNCAEIVMLLEGSIEHVVGEETLMMSAGDVLLVPAGVPHRAVATPGQDVEMVIAYTSGRRGFVALE